MDEPTEVECMFCGEAIDLDHPSYVVQSQVVFGGYYNRTSKVDGKSVKHVVMRKNPGKTVRYHNICGVPEGPWPPDDHMVAVSLGELT